MKIHDFVFATKISEACELLRKTGESAYLIAGGTSTFFVKSRAPRNVIDINRLPLKGIAKKDGVFKIGACTTVNELMKYKAAGWVLNRVALRFVNQQVRNISTIGGNVAKVFYWCDFPVALRVLEGTLTLTGSATHRVKISEVFHNITAQKAAFKNAILEYIEIPQLTKGMGFGYAKETRTSEGFSSVTAAAFVQVEHGLIADVRIALGAVLPFPLRMFDLEASLKGKKADRSAVEGMNFQKLDKYNLTPREGMTPEYCRHLVEVKIADVVSAALAEATGGSL
ncbi:MAG TPA: FAD binding domain-containing protein [Elusimicrobiota bacterium]|nr:FAD binding domain-containing protein [Elusimicrobiota bacterium]